MKSAEVLREFTQAGALLEGHFVLSSGRHSPVFLQKALVFMDPARTEKLCRALAQKVRAAQLGPLDAIVSPAVGGLIPGYETARHLHLPALYVEREHGHFALRRGFHLQPGAKVLVVEDIVTTGVSSRECITAVRATGAEVCAEACLIDRSGGMAETGVPLIALAEVDFPTYAADAVPAELAAIAPQKPGSRDLHP